MNSWVPLFIPTIVFLSILQSLKSKCIHFSVAKPWELTGKLLHCSRELL